MLRPCINIRLSAGKKIPSFHNTESLSRKMSYYSTDNRIVTHARVVAHLSQDLGGGVSENHWSVYLLLEDETSIRMNMAAGDDGIGRLEFTPYNYQLTTSALRHWDYAMVAGVPVSYIYTMTYNFGRDRYQFSGGGSGCRYWW